MHRQRGITTVEFALVGSLLMVLLFGVIEFGRALFIANALAEGTRRAARLAAICPVGDPRPAQAAIFSESGSSLIAPELNTSNVVVSYLNSSGGVLANPNGSYNSIQYVQVSINYTHQMLIPFIDPSLVMPAFTATLPRESLGYSPTLESFPAC